MSIEKTTKNLPKVIEFTLKKILSYIADNKITELVQLKNIFIYDIGELSREITDRIYHGKFLLPPRGKVTYLDIYETPQPLFVPNSHFERYDLSINMYDDRFGLTDHILRISVRTKKFDDFKDAEYFIFGIFVS